MSSRNQYLNEAQRDRALCLSQALEQARACYAQGERNAGILHDVIEAKCLNGTVPIKIEYIELVAYETFAPVERVGPGTLVALAVRIGETRLIDNVIL